jgi:hypothetical protein
MNPPLIMIRVWGIISIVMACSMLFNAGFYVRLVKALQDETTRFLYFFVVLVVGAVSVSVLNQWTLNAAGLATLLGWGALFKGTVGTLLPNIFNRIVQKVGQTAGLFYIAGIIFLVIGVYLLFVGFVY